ncbi:MAG TPA: hypothetical protein VIW73_10600 [Candidatus Cybelea sp.]
MRTRLAIGLLAVAIVLGFAAANRHELLRAAMQEGAGLASGYSVSIGDLRVARDGATLYGVRVSRGAQPILSVERAAIRYSLRDLLPGSAHRFGIEGIDVAGARVTLTRFRDGSFSIGLPGGAPGAPGPPRVNPVPLRLHVRLRDAQIELREPSAYDVSAKAILVGGVAADADVDTAAVTSYRVNGTFASEGGEPFEIGLLNLKPAPCRPST